MSAAACSFPVSDVWVLACATKFDTDEASSALTQVCRETASSVKFALHVFTKVLEIRSTFQRVVSRQERLIERLEAVVLVEWAPADCAKMAALLSELISDNRSMLACAGQLGSFLRSPWSASLETMEAQTVRLDRILDDVWALAETPIDPPHNLEMGQYIAELDLSRAHDFSTEKESKRVRHFATR
jgi:hypothetical protein